VYLPSDTNDSTRFSHLLRIPDVWTILNETGLIHGKDYTILKFLIRDGEEWNGQIPLSTIPLSDIPMLIQNKSFSLVIHDMQTKWIPIMELAQDLELELLPSSVSCNLYWTPPASSRAFETHLDWMDVIVLQLQGEKDWSIWNQPMIQWVLPDQKQNQRVTNWFSHRHITTATQPFAMFDCRLEIFCIYREDIYTMPPRRHHHR
jgi:hypothetical protein